MCWCLEAGQGSCPGSRSRMSLIKTLGCRSSVSRGYCCPLTSSWIGLGWDCSKLCLLTTDMGGGFNTKVNLWTHRFTWSDWEAKQSNTWSNNTPFERSAPPFWSGRSIFSDKTQTTMEGAEVYLLHPLVLALIFRVKQTLLRYHVKHYCDRAQSFALYSHTCKPCFIDNLVRIGSTTKHLRKHIRKGQFFN